MPPPPSRCIECEELELARVHDARPVQTVPIPAAALAGLPEGRRPGDLTRRRLLQAGVAGFASVFAPRALGFERMWEAAVAQAAAPPPNSALVLLYLAGGNDGLNTIVPVSGSDWTAYAAKRPAIGRGQGPSANGKVGTTVIPGTGGTLGFANVGVSQAGGGDNGSSVGLDTLYAAGNLAILPAVDYTPPNLSHFDSSDYWFAGALAKLTTGWLGRWLDRHGDASNPLQAVSLDTSISKAIRTTRAPVCAIPALAGLGFSFAGTPGVAGAELADANAAIAALAGVPAGAGNAALIRARQSYGQAVTVAHDVGALTAPAAGGLYPAASKLAQKLQIAATLLSANLGTRIITIHWGSFDTHGGQIGQQDPQLSELSQCLGAFQADLAARGLDGRVSTLVFSEFGRRVAENASAGTDHGAGGLMMALGTPVRGGWAAPFPGLGTLDRTGDLLVPTDFRSVYQSVIGEWLGTDPAEILGASFPEPQRQDSSGSGALFAT